MIIKEEYLVKTNNKNRVQQVLLQLDFDQKKYDILRTTSQYGGKQRLQPIITITEGKVNRTVSEQANLQYVSVLKDYMDNGYKRLSTLTTTPYKNLSEEDIKGLLGTSYNTDTKGIPKPMLAKSASDLSTSIFEKEWYCSRKLDGARCLMYYKNGKILTSSRGGLDYNASTIHITTNPILLQIFEKNPDLILDGELYHFGWPLQKISGLCRLKEFNDECKGLEYWIYDYVSDKPFKERYEFLMEIQPKFTDTDPIKVIDHYKLSGWLTIKKNHDEFVKEGFEGLCARNPNKEYGIGKRSGVYLVKLKEYQDAEFEIIGVREGLRDEDMCFVLKTDKGKEFAAKPACDTATRLEYLKNKDKYIGQMATCKFFYYSEDGVPLQPVFKSIRYIEDIDKKND